MEFSTGSPAAEPGRFVFGIGVFDGVHRGHRRIIDAAVKHAAERDALPAALTFDPHPRAVLSPGEPPVLLQPLAERIRLLREAGAERVWIVRFTRKLSMLEPEEFLRKLISVPGWETAGIAVGEKWRFGHGGRGDTALLKKFCTERGMQLDAVPELCIGERIVSSSAIRQAVAAGRLAEAAHLLGRPFLLTGSVECGHQAAGTKLACPTANLQFTAGVLPPDGVYAARALLGNEAHPAVVNIGFSPTFGWENSRRRVEVHLLDFNGNLYGAQLGVEFLRYLREERTFADPAGLKRQIGQDLAQVREYYREQENGNKIVSCQ